MVSGSASNQAGGWWLRRALAATATAGAPIAAAATRAAEEQRHAKCDQQERADEVEHADGDEAKVLGDAERADDDECDGEDSHDVLRAEVGGWFERIEAGKRQRSSPGAGGWVGDLGDELPLADAGLDESPLAPP